MFQLAKEEYKYLKFQFETSNWNEYGVIRKLPYVFTEEGSSMLSEVLHAEVAEEMNIKIMDAFVATRKYISSSLINIVNNIIFKWFGRQKMI